MKRTVLALLAGLSLAGCADMPAPGIYGPTWGGARSADATDRYYPPAASSQGIPGVATVLCRMGEGGRLKDCEVVFESRPGYGFGAAAMRMAEEIHVTENVPPVGRKAVQTFGFCNTEPGCAENERVRAELRAAFDRAMAARRAAGQGAPDAAP